MSTLSVTNLEGFNAPNLRASLGVSVIGPSFRASVVSQSVINITDTLVSATVEDFDYGSRYNNTSGTVSGIPAWSFMPDVPGVYMATLNAQYTGPSFTGFFAIKLFKNGIQYAELDVSAAAIQQFQHQTASDLVYLNGSTDYINFYVGHTQGSTQPITSVISACLVREVL
jgi:hypothetical protein